jgi:hypothetical protein
MNKLKKAFEKLVLKNPDNFIIIFYHGGMAGSSLLRILSAHEELYHSFKDLKQVDYDDPLRYPDSVEGFHIDLNHELSFKEQHLACAHIQFHTPWENEEDLLKYFELVMQGKKIALKTHDFSHYEKYKKSKCIFVTGDNLTKRRRIKYNWGNPPFLPKEVIKVNMYDLMSTDYNIFLEEYLKLVYEFNLTPRINSVRAFVLMWLERQERFNKTLS